jgi:hypothetical protein
MKAAHPNCWNNLIAPCNLIEGHPINVRAITTCKAVIAKTGMLDHLARAEMSSAEMAFITGKSRLP